MKLITFISACLIGVSVWAQDCHYDEISKGTYWVMTNFDKKGKLESSSAQTIKYIDENAKGLVNVPMCQCFNMPIGYSNN